MFCGMQLLSVYLKFRSKILYTECNSVAERWSVVFKTPSSTPSMKPKMADRNLSFNLSRAGEMAVLKYPCCYCRGPGFPFQHLRGGPETPRTPTPGDLTPPSGLHSYQAQTCRQNNHTHKEFEKKKRWLAPKEPHPKLPSGSHMHKHAHTCKAAHTRTHTVIHTRRRG